MNYPVHGVVNFGQFTVAAFGRALGPVISQGEDSNC